MTIVTKEPVKRLIKHAGGKRVSEKAAEELAKLMEERAKAIVTEAGRLSSHAGRRTVQRKDIKAASKSTEK